MKGVMLTTSTSLTLLSRQYLIWTKTIKHNLIGCFETDNQLEDRPVVGRRRQH